MTQLSWTDVNRYTWSADVNDGVSPAQINGYTTGTITAESGEQQAFEALNGDIVASDPNDPHTVFQVAFNQLGKQFYPVTRDEQALADNADAASNKMLSFTQTSATVVAEAQAIVNVLNVAAEVAAALFFIPVVGATIAAIGGTIAAVDEAKVQPAINELAQLLQKGFGATLDLAMLRLDIIQHNITLDDAKNKLTQWGQDSVSNFWQALADCIKALP
jgi:hypothetical protein